MHLHPDIAREMTSSRFDDLYQSASESYARAEARKAAHPPRYAPRHGTRRLRVWTLAQRVLANIPR